MKYFDISIKGFDRSDEVRKTQFVYTKLHEIFSSLYKDVSDSVGENNIACAFPNFNDKSKNTTIGTIIRLISENKEQIERVYNWIKENDIFASQNVDENTSWISVRKLRDIPTKIERYAVYEKVNGNNKDYRKKALMRFAKENKLNVFWDRKNKTFDLSHLTKKGFLLFKQKESMLLEEKIPYPYIPHIMSKTQTKHKGESVYYPLYIKKTFVDINEVPIGTNFSSYGFGKYKSNNIGCVPEW